MIERVGPAALLALAFGGCGGNAAPSPANASSTLTARGCVIAEGASSCASSISWAVPSAKAPRITLGGVTISTDAVGTASPSIGIAAQTVSLFDGSSLLGERTVAGACASASAWEGTRCRAYAERLAERAPTPFVENGRPVFLEVVIFRPFGPGPFPAVMFHHGSTGDGTDPSLFTQTYSSETIAQFFTGRGWLVVFPQRRGRGGSDGLYDEGFTPDRSRYSCLMVPSIAGFEHAMADGDAAVAWVSARADVNPTRLLSAGVSRGGVLALTHAAQRSGAFLGGVNFVGGWLGEGCAEGPAVNRALFQRAGGFSAATIWMYGENDTFYSMAHSRGNFSVFTAAGGKGVFNAYTRAPGLNGHNIVNDPHLWTENLRTFMERLGG